MVTRSDLGNQGHLLFQEFQDVVMLRHVHRTYDENNERVREMSSEERAQFLAEGRRFQEVMERMSDLTWTMEDHAWLANWRNRSVLARTREGREVLEAFEGCPILMDTRKQRHSGEDGAVRMKRWQLCKS